jgi:hypothetical protein
VSNFDDDELRKPQYVKAPLSTTSIVLHTIVAMLVVALLLAGLAAFAFVVFFLFAMQSYGSSQ